MADLAIGRHREVVTRYHRNQQYSITALTNASGTIVERYRYAAYGEPVFLAAAGKLQHQGSFG